MGILNKRHLLFAFCLAFFIIMLVVIQKDDNELVNSETSEEQLYTNLEAFSKLYGYVRYFHPSDEAAELDWEQFAIYGVDKVKGATNERELKEVLEELFIPLAPTMSLYLGDEQNQRKQSEKESLEVIAWQHYGMGTPEIPNSFYKSERISASIENESYVLETDKLFDEFPEANELIQEKVSPEINCLIPLVLFKDDVGTIGHTETSRESFVQLLKAVDSVEKIHSSQNENVRFAGIIVTWNVFQHFYPYFDVTDSDWDSQLGISLRDTVDDTNRDDYVNSLIRMLEKTKDGHVKEILSSEKYPWNEKWMPFVIDIIESKLVVTVADLDSGLQLGDIILSKNGVDSLVEIERIKLEIPGSPQLKSYLASKFFRFADSANLQIERDGELLDISINGVPQSHRDEFNRMESFKEIEEGVYYIDLTKDTINIFKENVETLSKAKGIIFDMRGYHYTSGVWSDVIGHLIEKPIKGPVSE